VFAQNKLFVAVVDSCSIVEHIKALQTQAFSNFFQTKATGLPCWCSVTKPVQIIADIEKGCSLLVGRLCS